MPKKKIPNNTKTSGIQSRIEPVHELNLVIAALFYGKSGTGKTTVSATFPKPALFLDIREKGTDSIADLKNVDMLTIDDWDDFESVYWYLKGKDHKYKTVVIDTTSQLQDYALQSALSESGNKNEIASKRTWGMASGKLKTWIMNYRDLVEEGINIVFITHERAREDEESENDEMVPNIGPNMIPSVASILSASVKVIGNTFIRETRIKEDGKKSKRVVSYCMRLGPHASYITKIRQPKGSYTPDFIDDPSYEKLVSIMKGDFTNPASDTKPTIRRKIKHG